MTHKFETRWITLTYRGTGDLTVQSDGLIDSGVRTISEVNADLEKLCEQGWTLVCDMEHKGLNGKCPGRDLYYRRTVPNLNGSGAPNRIWKDG